MGHLSLLYSATNAYVTMLAGNVFSLILPEILASGLPLAANARPLGLERHLRREEAFKEGN